MACLMLLTALKLSLGLSSGVVRLYMVGPHRCANPTLLVLGSAAFLCRTWGIAGELSRGAYTGSSPCTVASGCGVTGAE